MKCTVCMCDVFFCVRKCVHSYPIVHPPPSQPEVNQLIVSPQYEHFYCIFIVLYYVLPLNKTGGDILLLYCNSIFDKYSK